MKNRIRVTLTLAGFGALSIIGCRFDPTSHVGDRDATTDIGPASCGDGRLAQNEECDDGNNRDGDGCSALCEVETGWTCNGEPSVCESSCGNGTLDPGEDCDGDDLGSATCGSLGHQPGILACHEDCTFDTSGCGASLCGNGTVDPGEDCDEGGQDTATCDSDCTTSVCGDGHVNTAAGEECDENGQDTASCDSDCSLPECGDGHLNQAAGEVCDDGNTASGDGCSADCHSNETCGNGILDPGEECDSAGQDTADCDSDCTTPVCGDSHVNAAAGEECDGGGQDTADCDSDCTTPVCGDDHINTAAGEECEGTDLNGGTCENQGYDGGTLSCDRGCHFDASQCWSRICGDGIVVPGEECDDGNTTPGDGCSDSCTVEPYFVCEGTAPSVCSCRVYVDSGPVSSSTRDGASWASAYDNIQSGINKAADLVTNQGLNRCDVWVAEGDYPIYADSSSNTVSLASHVAILGGFDRTEQHPEDRDLTTNSSVVSGCDALFLNCNNQVEHVFTADQVTDATMDGLVIRDGYGGSSGGGLWLSDSLVFIQSCQFHNNYADDGGALHVRSNGIARISDSTFDDNHAVSNHGGAIWLESGEVHIQNGTFSQNSADSNGGAIKVDSNGSLFTTDTNFENNEATYADGGAVFVTGGQVDIQSGALTSNQANINGGAIAAENQAALNLAGVRFGQNQTSAWYGGAIHCDHCSLDAQGSTFDQNSAGDRGGAVSVRGGGTASFSRCVFTQNSNDSGGYAGGAIAVWESNSSVDTTSCRFVSNRAGGSGGAIWVSGDAQLTVSRGWFETNRASVSGGDGGGAIHTDGNNTNITVTDSLFWQNSTESSDSGGAIRMRGGSDGRIVNCTFTGNEVEGNNSRTGGVFARDNNTVADIINCILWNDVGPETGDFRGGAVNISYSDVQGQADTNNHVISQDPQWVDANNGNFELDSGSPCIDAANGDEASNADLMDRIRWDDPNVADTGTGNPTYVDMGALERQP